MSEKQNTITASSQTTNFSLLSCFTRMLRELAVFRHRVLWAGLLLLMTAVLTMAGSFLLGGFTDAVLSAGETDQFGQLLFMLFLSLVFSMANQFYWGQLHQDVAFSLREKLAGKLLCLPYSWFEAHGSGDLVIRMNTDLEQVLSLYGRMRNIAVSCFSGLCSLMAIVCIHPVLAAGYLFFPIFSQIFIYVSSRRLDPQFKKRQQLLGETASCCAESLNSLFEIKAMGCEASILARYRAKVQSYISHLLHLEKGCTATDTALDMIGGLQSLLLVAFGGLMVFRRQISMGDLLAAQMLSGNVSRAVSSVNFFELRLHMASALRVFEILDCLEEKVTVTETEEGPAVILEQVSFSYPGRREMMALRQVDLAVYEGEKVAVVGPSGSGKSSILKLIAGFYAPEKGTLYRRKGSWSMIGQDTFLFADTCYENIVCGDLSVGKETVERAAGEAELTDFIHSMPKGFQTLCKEQGRELSGGQRQRFSIARCLCRDPQLLLLDEPTSALDPETEAAVMENLLTAFKNKTLLLVTHNLSLVSGFDRIYVMEEGRVAEVGTHEELSERKGLYWRMLLEDRR